MYVNEGKGFYRTDSCDNKTHTGLFTYGGE